MGAINTLNVATRTGLLSIWEGEADVITCDLDAAEAFTLAMKRELDVLVVESIEAFTDPGLSLTLVQPLEASMDLLLAVGDVKVRLHNPEPQQLIRTIRQLLES